MPLSAGLNPSAFQNFIRILCAQRDALTLLKKRLIDQHAHLVRFRVADLETITRDIAELTAKIAMLEKERYEWVKGNLRSAHLKLTEVVPLAPPASRPALLDLHRELRDLSREVSRLTRGNAELMRSGSGLVQGLLNLYRHSLAPTPVYDRHASLGAAPNPGGTLRAQI
ncbi:MAG: flagellar protein FlgN [Nitrospirae bacterium]|nr:flagellar protein FlgN [Nitrospirota bacterium]